MINISFKAAPILSMQVPKELFEDTIHFYRDILLLEVNYLEQINKDINKSAIIKFGTLEIHLAENPKIKKARILLELSSNKLQLGLAYLKTNNIEHIACNENRKNQENYIKDPAGNLLILRDSKEKEV